MKKFVFFVVAFFLFIGCISSTSDNFIPKPSKGSIIPGTWISPQGAEYIFNGNEMVCIYVPPELNDYFQLWKGYVALKITSKTNNEFTAKQALRNRSMEAMKWIDVSILFKSEDEFEIVHRKEDKIPNRIFIRDEDEYISEYNVPVGSTLDLEFVGRWKGEHFHEDGSYLKKWNQVRNSDGTYVIIFKMYDENNNLFKTEIGKGYWWIKNGFFHEVDPSMTSTPDIYKFEIVSDNEIKFTAVHIGPTSVGEVGYTFTDFKIK